MDLFRGFGNCCQYYKRIFSFSKTSNDKKRSPFSKYEYYTYKFQNILIWDNPAQTISCLLIIQLFFWMMVNLCWKFYGIIFTVLLIFCTHDVWTEKIWPEIRLPHAEVAPHQENMITNNPRILKMSQIEECFNDILLHVKMALIRLKNLRSSHPAMFCSLLSTFFGLLTVIGCTISGIWLLYVIVMTIFLTPGIYAHMLPQTVKTSVKQILGHLSSLLTSECENTFDEYDEFIPKMSEEKLTEAYASIFQLSNDLPDEDVASDLMAMPSFDDSTIDGTMSFADVKVNLDISDTSSVSSDLSGSMKFQGAHFNNMTDEFDTSDDDDVKAFIPDQQHRPKAQETLLSNIVSKIGVPDIHQLGRTIIKMIPSTSSISSSTELTSHRHHSTDEEFEIINESDVN